MVLKYGKNNDGSILGFPDLISADAIKPIHIDTAKPKVVKIISFLIKDISPSLLLATYTNPTPETVIINARNSFQKNITPKIIANNMGCKKLPHRNKYCKKKHNTTIIINRMTTLAINNGLGNISFCFIFKDTFTTY